VTGSIFELIPEQLLLWIGFGAPDCRHPACSQSGEVDRQGEARRRHRQVPGHPHRR
jgi:hypothetical protein